jgi:hypothetical protein
MKLQTFFENLRRQRNAIFTFVRRLILASKSFSSVMQCFFEIFIHHRIVDLRCVLVFNAKLYKSNAFALFRRNIDLTTSFFSCSNELALDFVAMIDDQSVIQVFM